MTDRKRILCVIGTRPEVIKMAPVILDLQQRSWAEVRILITAQHRELLDRALALFGLAPDIDLDIMQVNQTLSVLTSRLVGAIDEVFDEEQPAMVLAQGDTTTVMTTALCCFYRHIPFGHVEAGLRTGNKHFPFPEEMNRVIAGYLTRLHFAPTERACANLVREHVERDRIFVTGNTVIDALYFMLKRPAALPQSIDPDKRLILVTAHRRENFGKPLEAICKALRQIADSHADVQIFYPVHPNPNVTAVAGKLLGDHPRIVLSEPVEYDTLVALMNQAHLILTDSGGLQEEAPALAKPVLVLRDETERPEAVDAGVVKLVGPHCAAIVESTRQLLTDERVYRAMAGGASPYGDGKAAPRISRAIEGFFRESDSA